MKISKLITLIAALALASFSYADGGTDGSNGGGNGGSGDCGHKHRSLPKKYDNFYISAPNSATARVVEIGPIDPALDVKLINDHQIRLGRAHFKSGTFTVHFALNETASCVTTIESGHMMEKVRYSSCTCGWKMEFKRAGMASYNINFKQLS